MALPFRRGAVVVVASPGAYSGKPRPAVVLQATRWCEKHPSLTLCPITSTLVEATMAELDQAVRGWLDLG